MTRVKQRAVAMAHREVAVVVINRLLLVLIALVANLAQAAVLPDERIDILYHGYDGGGAQIDGPSILVRKSVGSSVSVAASYYVDMLSSASIDVQTNKKMCSLCNSEITSYEQAIEGNNEITRQPFLMHIQCYTSHSLSSNHD